VPDLHAPIAGVNHAALPAGTANNANNTNGDIKIQQAIDAKYGPCQRATIVTST
jgi:hypothetical protein